jgi:hypothetical protein
MLWEAAFISQKREWPNLKPKGRKIEAGLGPGIEVMLWGFDVPTPYRLMEKMIVRRLYLSASIGSSVFVLTTALGAADDPRTAARILLSVVRTLRVRTLPVELSTLSEEIKNGPRPWPGCATGAIP